jgi:hypothetical protein
MSSKKDTLENELRINIKHLNSALQECNKIIELLAKENSLLRETKEILNLGHNAKQN